MIQKGGIEIGFSSFVFHLSLYYDSVSNLINISDRYY